MNVLIRVTLFVFSAILLSLCKTTIVHAQDACELRTVDGATSDMPVFSDTLEGARSVYQSACPEYEVRDCDPVQSGGWVCSSLVIGFGAPGGLKDGEEQGFWTPFDSLNVGGVYSSASPGGGYNDNYSGSYNGGGNQDASYIQYPGNSSAGKIGSGDLLALHYDNCPDPDDGHAMAAASSMIATYGLNNLIVVNGTCGNTIKNLYDSDSEKVADTVFPNHLNAATNWTSSVNSSATKWLEALNAGKKVWVAEGGPSDFTADVVRKVSSTSSNTNLKNITVVQHAWGPASWNEGKADASNLNYVKAQTSYVTIPNGNHVNGSADLADSSSYFVNAANASDYALEWAAAFNYLPPSQKLDFSDTVELLYLVNDTTTKTVNDFADRYIIPPRPTGVVIVEPSPTPIDDTYNANNGVIMIEAESGTQTDGWDVRTAQAGYKGAGYIQWTGPNRFFKSEARRGNIYSFTIAEAGNYELRLRSRIMQGSNPTEHNDSWINFATGQDIPDEQALDGHTKVYMSQLNTWSWTARTVDGVGRKVRQRFSAGTHTVELAGRSTGHAVDRIALFEYDKVNFSAAAFDAMAPASTNTGILAAAPAAVTTNDTQPIATSTPGQPDYLSAFQEQNGFISTRVTDSAVFGTDSPTHAYSKRQAWSYRETYMMAAGKVMDGTTYNVLGDIPLSSESVWSNTNDSIIYGIANNNTLSTYNVATEQQETVYQFASYNKCTIGRWEGNISRTDDRVLIACETGNNYELIAFDIPSKTILGQLSSLDSLDWAAFSPSGKWIVVQNNNGSARQFLRYNEDFTTPRLLTTDIEHGDFAQDTMGREVYVMINGTDFSYVRLDDGQYVDLETGVSPGFGHISCRSDNPNLCLYSTYRDHLMGTFTIPSVDSDGQFVTLSASTTVTPWASHNSTGGTYEAQARASISRNGNRAVYASDRNGNADIASYVMQNTSLSVQ